MCVCHLLRAENTCLTGVRLYTGEDYQTVLCCRTNTQMTSIAQRSKAVRFHHSRQSAASA